MLCYVQGTHTQKCKHKLTVASCRCRSSTSERMRATFSLLIPCTKVVLQTEFTIWLRVRLTHALRACRCVQQHTQMGHLARKHVSAIFLRCNMMNGYCNLFANHNTHYSLKTIFSREDSSIFIISNRSTHRMDSRFGLVGNDLLQKRYFVVLACDCRHKFTHSGLHVFCALRPHRVSQSK